MQMLCAIPKGSDVFSWHKPKHFVFMAQALNFNGISTFYGKNAEAFKLLGMAPEFIYFPYFRGISFKFTDFGSFYEYFRKIWKLIFLKNYRVKIKMHWDFSIKKR